MNVMNVFLAGGLGNRIFGLDPQLLLDSCITILAMLFLAFFLSFLLFIPARLFLQKRQDGIREQMETAAREKDDALKFKAEYDDKLKNVQKESEEILTETRKKALKKETEIIGEAKEEAARVIDRANREAELEKNKVKDQVKQEVISVATLMAGKIVASSLDESKQSQLIADTLEEMGDDTWLS